MRDMLPHQDNTPKIISYLLNHKQKEKMRNAERKIITINREDEREGNQTTI